MFTYWQRWGLIALICQSILSHHVTRCRLLWCCSVLYYTMSVYCLTHCCLYPFVNIFQRKKEICPWEYIERMVVSIIVASMKDENYKDPRGRIQWRTFITKEIWNDTWYNFIYVLCLVILGLAGKQPKDNDNSELIRINKRTNGLYCGRQ